MSTESGAAGVVGALSGVGSTVRGGAGGFLALAGIAEHVEGRSKGDLWAHAGLMGDEACLAQAYMGEAWATPILAAGLTVLTAYSLTCGFPFTPDEGGKFANGAAKFGEVGHALGAARPSGEWTGSGSDNYLQRCREQLDCARRMADADQQLHAIMAEQAGQVRAARDAVDHGAAVLGIAIPFAMLLMEFGPIGILDSELFQISLTATTLGWVTPAIEKLMSEAAVNAARILNVAGEYGRVAAEASRSRSMAGFEPSRNGVAPRGTPRSAPPPPPTPGPVGAQSSAGAPGGPAVPSGGSPGAPAAPNPGLSAGPSGTSGGGAPRDVAPVGGTSAAETATPPTASAATLAGATVAPTSAGTGAPAGGLPGLPGGGPAGGVSGLPASMLGPAAQAATQALGQTGQGTPTAPAAGQSQPPAGVPAGAQRQVPPAGPAELASDKRRDDAANDDAPPSADQKAVAGAGPAGQETRAPIHVEIELDPSQLTAPVHVVLDPKNAVPGSPG